MFAYLRLAGGEFGSGHIEEGYAALEKAVDLYIAYEELPSGTKLKYNCSALDMLTVEIDKDYGDACANALHMLTNWAWFKKVRDEERFASQTERLKAHLGK